MALDKNVDRLAERRRRAIAGARSAVEKLHSLGVEASVFGSLASGTFSAHSDVDLLVTQCPRQLKYAIEGLVEDSLEGLRFDVVYLDEIPASRRSRILQEAVGADELR